MQETEYDTLGNQYTTGRHRPAAVMDFTRIFRGSFFNRVVKGAAARISPAALRAPDRAPDARAGSTPGA